MGGGGNTGRNTTIIRSNYLWDESAALYEKSVQLFEGLSQELNYNVMFSRRGVLNLAHNLGDVREGMRRVNAPRLNGIDSEWLTVAGFDYKTFMHPQSFWITVCEPQIRRAAGLGRAPREPDQDIYDNMHAHCDVLVVGAGPSGLMAARSAARVILADEQLAFGGALSGSTDVIDGVPAAERAACMSAELGQFPAVRLLPRTTVTGYYDHNDFIMAERKTDQLRGAAPGSVRQRRWKVRAARVVLATVP